jgi:hypothetical protein
MALSIGRSLPGPAWAASLGVIAVLFGALLTAAQGQEFLVQATLAPDSAAARNVPVECRADEAAEEEVSVAECELMIANVKIMLASRPSWFRPFQMRLALTGAVVALLSVIVGIALVDYRAWAPRAAVVVFSTLLLLDAVGFTAALYTGPLLRALYLWNIVLWFTIHLCLAASALAGRRAMPA